MTDIERTEQHKSGFKHRSEQNRAETDRAYAEIQEAERKARLEKTMRLRRMRLITTQDHTQSL
jgi:hypothetical protein